MYGRLTVIKNPHSNKHGKALWLCECACGNRIVVVGTDLRNGATQSCGCLRDEKSAARSGEKSPHWGKTGQKSSSWRGGRRMFRGYILLLDHSHPRSHRGYVYEHIVVMEKMLGRPLNGGEVIHHCNGVKSDNRPYNLRLFKNGGEHTAYHAKLKRDGMVL